MISPHAPRALPEKRPLMLASVTSPEEAQVCLKAGADIIDAKNPSTGALGALPRQTVEHIVAMARSWQRPVSATIGDLDCVPQPTVGAVRQMAATGVDYVKIGFLPGGDARAIIGALGQVEVGSAALVGVLFADLEPDLKLIFDMSQAGFAGVLMDTANKVSGSLTEVVSLEQIAEFVRGARDEDLFAGLAGSLRLEHVDKLLTLKPDILGFRGALCLDRRRTFGINETFVQQIRVRLDTVGGRVA
jgi:(5-formylfuran-3-yl)methyl phosphate synthase